MAAITGPSQMSSKPLGSSRRRRRMSPNGAGGVYFSQSTSRWMGRYTTDDPETGIRVRKAVYGRTEQEARAKLIEALAARQAGSLLVTRGREFRPLAVPSLVSPYRFTGPGGISSDAR
jgi:hypothetical protein